MKKIMIGMVAGICLLMTSCGNMNQVLSAMTNGTGVVNAITSVIGLDKISAQNLIGTWRYDAPGCAFTSKNLLAKAGGEVAAVQIEEKLAPYYQQVGISSSNTYITFNQDGTFSSKIVGTNFSGTYTFNEADQQIKLKGLLLSINCYAKRELNGISILFEGKKLLNVLQTMAALSGRTDLQTIGELSKVKNSRLEALRLIISSQQLGSQDELLAALQKEGFKLTQATLSRDLKQLKVAKAASMSGNYVYVLPNETMYKRVSTPNSIREMLKVPGFISINFSGNMGVIKTRPGYASSIAWNIDNSDIPEIIGTIAGDDTIFIVIKEGVRHQDVSEALSEVVPSMR